MPEEVKRSNAYGNVTVNWTPALDDLLCDLIATDDYPFADMARIMGLPSRDVVSARWRRLVARYDWQASWPTSAGPGPHRLTGDRKTPVRVAST